MVDETTLVACGLCSLVQADACTVFLSKALCTSISMALYYSRGAQGGPPLVDAEVSGREDRTSVGCACMQIINQ